MFKNISVIITQRCYAVFLKLISLSMGIFMFLGFNIQSGTVIEYVSAQTTSSYVSKSDFRKEFKKTVELKPDGRLSLKNYKGGIRMSSWNQNQVEIIARIEAPDNVSRDYARRIVEAAEIEVWGNEKYVKIRSNNDDIPRGESWFGFGDSKVLPFIYYEIRAPRNLDLQVEDHKSDIEIDEFEGSIDIETYKGTMEGNSLSGDIRLKTYKGNISFSKLRGQLDIQTYKGDIWLDVVEINGDCRLETYKGKIDLNMSETQGFFMRANIGKKGELYSDFGNHMRNRYWDNERLRKSINGGGPEIYIDTYKGDIRLRSR